MVALEAYEYSPIYYIHKHKHSCGSNLHQVIGMLYFNLQFLKRSHEETYICKRKVTAYCLWQK